MNRPSARSIRATLLSLVAAALVFPSTGLAQTEATDLTPAFIENGAVIEDLTAVAIGGIMVIRGKTSDKARAEDASRIATSLGYSRVANLIVIRDDATADAAIEYTGHRRLELERALAGCRFRVQSKRGVIRLTGVVDRDAQADLAVQILSRINGVREVHPHLTRP